MKTEKQIKEEIVFIEKAIKGFQKDIDDSTEEEKGESDYQVLLCNLLWVESLKDALGWTLSEEEFLLPEEFKKHLTS